MVTQGEKTTQKRSERQITGTCEVCGNQYPARAGKRHCSPTCRAKAWRNSHQTVTVSPDGLMRVTVVVKSKPTNQQGEKP